MYRGRRRKAAAGPGYRPKRLRGPGKRLLEGPPSRPQWTGAGRLLRCAAVAAALCALAFTGAADLSAAYLHDRDSVDNTFVLGSVDPKVTETFDGTKKENVAIENGGNAPVYIRALILAVWQDKLTGAALSEKPEEGVDYTLAGPAEDSGWTLGGDGCYYFTRPVQPGASTDILIRTLTENAGDPDGTRQLCVDIIAQSVQAGPAQAVEDVFRGAVVGADGILTPP